MDNQELRQLYRNVENPGHYTWLKEVAGVEPIDITRHLDFNLGNCIKYILRKGKEGNPRIQDLLKAKWYLEDEIRNIMGFKEKEAAIRNLTRLGFRKDRFSSIDTTVNMATYQEGDGDRTCYVIDTPSDHAQEVEGVLLDLEKLNDAYRKPEEDGQQRISPTDSGYKLERGFRHIDATLSKLKYMDDEGETRGSYVIDAPSVYEDGIIRCLDGLDQEHREEEA